jgi:uncharacterized protein (DUF2147 family)
VLRKLVFLSAYLAATPCIAEPPEGLWLAEDRSVMIAAGACEPGSAEFCGIIVGIEAPGLASYAKDLCNLPLLWGFTEAAPGRWEGGELLDPETGKTHPVELRITPTALEVMAEGSTFLTWTRTLDYPQGCPD